jgi:hypothetical protein
MNDHRSVKVAVIPDCDVCQGMDAKVPAYADAKLCIGPWANVCKFHFDYYGCSLGLGRGQELVAVDAIQKGFGGDIAPDDENLKGEPLT